MKSKGITSDFDPKVLKKLRKAKKLSFLELSRGLQQHQPKVSKNSVWHWETGLHAPNMKSLRALSIFFSVPIETFMRPMH